MKGPSWLYILLDGTVNVVRVMIRSVCYLPMVGKGSERVTVHANFRKTACTVNLELYLFHGSCWKFTRVGFKCILCLSFKQTSRCTFIIVESGAKSFRTYVHNGK